MSNISGKLAGKHAIVTGASKGIGAAIAIHLGSEGARVIVNYSSDKDGADRVVTKIKAAGGEAIAIGANVAKATDIDSLVSEAVKNYGPVDVLVNNAGVFDFGPIETITPEFFHRLFDINVLGLILVTRQVLSHFSADGGSIVNMSSVVSRNSPIGASVYNATKSAVDGLTRSFSKELAPRKIRVNSINPGPVETDGVHAQGLADTFQELGSQTALGRVGKPDDIARGVLFLASPDSAWMTGEMLHINGGNK